MMTKTITRWAAAFLILGSMLPLSAQQTKFEVNKIWYEFIDKNTVKVVENEINPYVGEIVIPDFVTRVGSSAKKLKVTTIGTNAFSNSDITSIKLPQTLRTIQEQSFDGSTIKKLVVPYGVESIGANAFYNCRQLEKALLPSTLVEVGEYAFAKCTKMSELVLLMDLVPQGLDTQTDVFGGSDVLANLTVYTTVQGLEVWKKFKPFGASQPFKFVKLYSSQFNGIAYEVISGALMTARVSHNTGVREAVISERVVLDESEFKVTELRDEAFRTNYGLNKLVLPATIVKVGEKAFMHAIGIVEIYCLGEVPPQFTNEDDPFYSSVYKYATLYVPIGYAHVYSSSVGWSHFNKVMETTGIDETTANSLQVYAAEGAVAVKGVAEGMPVSVYNVLGALVAQGCAEGEEMWLDVPQKGVYLVRVGEKCCKVLVN